MLFRINSGELYITAPDGAKGHAGAGFPFRSFVVSARGEVS